MRPRRAEQSSTEVIRIRVTPDERTRLENAALANRQTPSDFARDAIVTAASETLEDDPESESGTDSD